MSEIIETVAMTEQELQMEMQLKWDFYLFG